jgi:hypothetical protein
LKFVDNLFVCDKCCCGCGAVECCGVVESCGCGCGAPAPAAAPKAAPAVKEAPLPKAPKADPSASLIEPRTIHQASRSIVQD